MHLFTLPEANALIPQLTALFAEIESARKRIEAVQPSLWPVLQQSATNGGNANAGRVVEEFERIKRCVQAIRTLGVEVKDLNTGLIDFPAERDGHVVYLCWRYGEESIAFWHELDAGFTGRQPL
jgi:hypothetical protein